MKGLILFFCIIPFFSLAQEKPGCILDQYTISWKHLSDNVVWGGPRKDRKPIEEKMKPHLAAGIDWLKSKSANVTGTKLAEYYYVYQHGTAADKHEGNAWYHATGRLPYFFSKVNSSGLFCDNGRVRSYQGPANIFVYINYANELVRPMTMLDEKGNAVPLRINGKVIFEVPHIKRSEGRVDYYEYPGPPPPTIVNYDKWEFINGYIIRNSDKPFLIPCTRKEYLQQYLLEMEKYYKKTRNQILKETNVTPPEEIDKALRDRIAEIRKLTEQNAYGYAKSDLGFRIKKAEEFYRNKKEEEAGKINNLTREADEQYAASVQMIRDYLRETASAELQKSVPYRLGEKLTNTLYDPSFTQRTLDRMEGVKPGTRYWGDTKELCYINPSYFNNALSPDLPQLITVEFVNLQDLHKNLNAIVANINRDFDFNALSALFPGNAKPVVSSAPQVIPKKGGNSFMPKAGTKKSPDISFALLKGDQDNDILHATVSAAQHKENFDLASYSVPSNWKKETGNGFVSHAITNPNNGEYAKLIVYASIPGTGSLKDDFDKEWNDLVYTPYKPASKPESTEEEIRNNWKIKSGTAPFVFNGGQSVAVLITAVNRNTKMSLVFLCNSETYMHELEKIGNSLQFKEVKSSATDMSIPANGSTFTFSSSNFDDGWVSTVHDEYVLVERNHHSVYLNFSVPYNASQFSGTGIRDAAYYWDQYVTRLFTVKTKQFNDAGSMALKPPYMEGQAIDKRTGKACFIGMYLLIVPNAVNLVIGTAPDEAAFRKLYPRANDPFGSDLAAMERYNKFAVAAKDIVGKWQNGNTETAHWYYVSPSGYEGYAGMTIAATSAVFQFHGNGNYTSIHNGATGAAGNMKTFQQEFKGKYSVDNWSITASNRHQGKTDKFDAHFVVVKGGRILKLNTGAGQNYSLVRVSQKN